MHRILLVPLVILVCLRPATALPTRIQDSGPATPPDPSRPTEESTPSAPRGMRPMDRFRAMDTDRSGSIDREEFLAIPMLRRFPDLFDRIDIDGNGRVGPAEFVALRRYADALRNGQRPADEDVPDGVRRRADIVYLPAGDPLLQSLDLYLPMPMPAKGEASTREPRPVLVMIHGGGWKGGDKANAGVILPKAEWAVDLGWVFASVNYRLSPAVQHPDHAMDVAAAIAWIRDHAPEFDADPERIVVMGHSAGANLAALVATDRRLLGAHGMEPADLAGVVLLDGAGYDVPWVVEQLPPGSGRTRMFEDAFGPRWEEIPSSGEGEDATRLDRWRDASPQHHIVEGRSYPPMLVVHQGSRWLAARTGGDLVAALRRVGGRGRLVPVDKDHVGCNRDLGVPGDDLTVAVAAFLDGLSESTTPDPPEQTTIQSR